MHFVRKCFSNKFLCSSLNCIDRLFDININKIIIKIPPAGIEPLKNTLLKDNRSGSVQAIN